MERVHQHAEVKGKGSGEGGIMMEHSGTALPTCHRIFYYYGDFSMAPSFEHNREKRDIEQKERNYLRQRGGDSEQRDVNSETF